MMINIENHSLAKLFLSENVGNVISSVIAPYINPFQTEVSYETASDDEYGDGYLCKLHDKTSDKGAKYFVPDNVDVVVFSIICDKNLEYEFIVRFEYDENTHLVKYSLEPVNKPNSDDENFQRYAQMSMHIFQGLKSYEQQVIGH